MRVKVEEAGVVLLDVFVADEVDGHVVLAAHDANGLVELEEILHLFQIDRGNGIHAEAERDQHEHRIALIQQLLDLIQKEAAMWSNRCYALNIYVYI